MIREILFRVWAKGKMTNVEYPERITIGDGHITFWDQANHTAILDAVFMQFIGEKDKNGKKIYEGDIIRGRYGKDVVRFIDAGFHPFCGDINVPNPNESEVLGNIYETPELLK